MALQAAGISAMGLPAELPADPAAVRAIGFLRLLCDVSGRDRRPAGAGAAIEFGSRPALWRPARGRVDLPGIGHQCDRRPGRLSGRSPDRRRVWSSRTASLSRRIGAGTADVQTPILHPGPDRLDRRRAVARVFGVGLVRAGHDDRERIDFRMGPVDPLVSAHHRESRQPKREVDRVRPHVGAQRLHLRGSARRAATAGVVDSTARHAGRGSIRRHRVPIAAGDAGKDGGLSGRHRSRRAAFRPL